MTTLPVSRLRSEPNEMIYEVSLGHTLALFGHLSVFREVSVSREGEHSSAQRVPNSGTRLMSANLRPPNREAVLGLAKGASRFRR